MIKITKCKWKLPRHTSPYCVWWNRSFSTPAHIVFGETGHFPLYSLIYCGFISDCTNLLPCPRKTKICIEQIFIPPILWWKCVLNSWLDCIQKLFDSCVQQTQGFNVNIKLITKLFNSCLVIEIILLQNL